jgi:ABC-type Fe3+-citrate transport system substrate-binding protein
MPRRKRMGWTKADRDAYKRHTKEFKAIDEQVITLVRKNENHVGNVWEIPAIAKLSKKRDRLIQRLLKAEHRKSESKARIRRRKQRVAARKRRAKRYTLDSPT